MKKIPKIDTRTIRERLCDLLFRPGAMSSLDRRNALIDAMLEWEKEHPEGLLINARYSANLHKDVDLQILAKQGKVTIHRVRTGKFRHTRFAETFLRVKR